MVDLSGHDTIQYGNAVHCSCLRLASFPRELGDLAHPRLQITHHSTHGSFTIRLIDSTGMLTTGTRHK